MKKHDEIEFKTMLTKEEYEELLKIYAPPSYTQKNIYLDTRSEYFRQRKIGCRIRIKENHFEFTLKEPKSEDITEESNWPLAQADVVEFQRSGVFTPEWLDLPEELISIGEIETLRSELPFQSGQLMIDQSTYFSVVDYELEFEAPDYTQGKTDFEEFLALHKLPYRPAKKKLVRMMEASE